MSQNHSTITTMNKNIHKFVKYIFPSCKEWTGVWLLMYRDLHLSITSIGRENIDSIVLEGEFMHNYCKPLIQHARNTYKSAAGDE